MILKKIVPLLVCLCFIYPSIAQEFKNYTINNSNLAGNIVKAVYIDKDGVIWFGTNKGLSRYDGQTWKTYTTADKLADIEITDIANQKTEFGNELWFATPNGASVAAYDVDGITSATSYRTDKFEILSNSIIAVAVDSLGTRYFGTPAGISVFKESSWDSATNNNMGASVPSQPILCLYTKDDSLYIGTRGTVAHEGGIGRLQMKVDGITGASIIAGPECGNINNTVYSIFIDKDNHQWFGTAEGVYEHVGQEFKGAGWLNHFTIAEDLVNNSVTAIGQDPSGSLWFGTMGGLSKLNNNAFTNFTRNEGLPGDTIFDIAFDKNGYVWCGTNHGATKFDGNNFENYFAGIVSERIQADQIIIYPNPLKESMTILIQLPLKTRLWLSIYNINNQLVMVEDIGTREPGVNKILLKATDASGNLLLPGIYTIQIRSVNFMANARMVVTNR